MALILFFLLIALPIIEIAIFIQAGAAIGWLTVIALTILTAVVGTALIRVQGFAALQQLRASMQDGKAPVAPVVDGVFLLVAAPLMMTPGFVTDAFGFLILVPPIRYALARIALKKIKRAMDDGKVTIIRQ